MSKMANSRRDGSIVENDPTENLENDPAPPASWAQPVKYHGVSAAGRGRGYFILVPHLPRVAATAAQFGNRAAEIDFSAALRALTQIAGARMGAKEVEKTREAEEAAGIQAFEEYANGTYKARGDDVDDADSDNRWNRVLLDTVRPYLTEALTTAGYELTETNVLAAFRQHYEALNVKYGAEAARKGFEPSKKGADKAAAVAPMALAI